MEEKGLVVISITDEETALVDGFVAEFGVTHPLVILKSGELESLIGVSGFPTSAVFTNGELTWTGHPAESSSAIGNALKSAKKGSIYPKPLAKVRALMKEGKQDAAYADILKNEAKYDAATAAWAARVKTYLEEQADAAFVAAQAMATEGFVYRALRTVGGYAGAESPMPKAGEMRAWMAKLEAETPEFKKEMAGGEGFEKAVALEKALDFTAAFEEYRAVGKKSKGTKIGDNADKAARAIVDGQKAGYNEHCEHCDGKTHRACNKHAEKLKI